MSLPAVRRVAVTRDEPDDGPLHAALRAAGLDPHPCPVLVEHPAPVEALSAAAAALDDVEWLVCASARAVRALRAVRPGPWTARLRTAAVGLATARALTDAGTVAPIVGDGAGAEALWARLAGEGPWTDRRVLVLTTPGGRTTLAERLRHAGARVHDCEAYRMAPRAAAAIACDWAAAAPAAAVIASPRAAEILAAAVGAEALRRPAIVAIGATTAAALARLDVPCRVAPAADFAAAARAVAGRLAGERA
jgi:uroporphyrinogen-III synthase